MAKKINNLEELIKELNALEVEKENKKKTGYSKLELDRVSYDAPSDDEIYNLAKNYVDEKYSKLSEDKKATSAQKNLSLSEMIEKAQKEYSEREKERENDYANSKKEIEDQAVKRGVARSSIVLNELADLENQKNAEKNQSKTALDDQIKAINSEIDGLDEQLNRSLKDLDMQKAIELNEKIEALKAERDQKTNDMIKYNNQIIEKEYNNNSQIESKINEHELAVETQYKRQMVNVVCEYLDALEPEQAFELLKTDTALRDALGDLYYLVYNAYKVKV